MHRTAQLDRAVRHVTFVATMFVYAIVSGLLFTSTFAFAQDPAAPAPAQADTVLGWVFKGVLTLVILGGGWAALKLSQFLAAKTQQTNTNAAETFAWSLVNKVWLKAQAVGGKLVSKEKALLDKILSDGVVTAEEFNTFKSAIANDLREIAAQEIPVLGSLIGGAGPVNSLIEGFASKVAHGLITGQTAAPTQTPQPAVNPAPTSP